MRRTHSRFRENADGSAPESSDWNRHLVGLEEALRRCIARGRATGNIISCASVARVECVRGI